MFKQYTGIEYMAIDIANHYGEVVIDTEMYDMLTIEIDKLTKAIEEIENENMQRMQPIP